jgi:hypothetical protein
MVPMGLVPTVAKAHGVLAGLVDLVMVQTLDLHNKTFTMDPILDYLVGLEQVL